MATIGISLVCLTIATILASAARPALRTVPVPVRRRD